MLQLDDGQLVQTGFILRTKTGFDAVAKTTGYAPERSHNGFASMEEAVEFIEGFRPWEDFGGSGDLEVESEVQPRPA